MMAIVLRTDGYAVETALNGVSGLERIGSAAFDLVLLDLSMPGMDGRQVYQAARSVGYRGPIVICSAYGAVDTGRDLGAEGAMSKPFDPKDLCCVVRRLLTSAAARPQREL